MPMTKIELGQPWAAEEKQRLVDVVHGAMVEALKIPVHDKLIRIQEYGPGDFIVQPECSQNYVLVEICMFSGRSLDAKRKLYQLIVDGLETLGVARIDTRIVLHDIPKDNWGIRGGVPASEVDLGFKVDV
jgi:phenylpyruvate tautomerase PptA (4-oxalocrotonate tautomerase family)